MNLQTIFDILGSNPLFWLCALTGTGLFAVQFLLTLLGSDALGDDDAMQMQWLSKQTITGFLMMFGWIGLTCKKELCYSMPVTISIALAGGVASIFLIAYLFKAAKKLKSEGAVFRLDDAIGKEATVYHRIPRNGSGKITLSLYNLSYEIDAISHDAEEIPSFTQVQIVKKVDDKTVIVRCI